MAFIEGTDSSGEIAITVFPKFYRQFRQLFTINKVIFIQGKPEISKYNQELQLIGENFSDPDEMEKKYPDQTCYLRIKEEFDDPKTMQQLQGIIHNYTGYIPVVRYHEKNQRKVVLAQNYWVDGSENLKKQLTSLLDEGNVVLK